jgi:hypothetical protein
MKGLFLTHEELVEMTEFKNGSAQARSLRNMGYTFDVAPSGAPKLLRSAVEAKHAASAPAETATA